MKINDALRTPLALAAILTLYSLPILASNTVTEIAAGGSNGLFVRADGSLWAMGNNSQGALGNGNTVAVDHPIQIVATNVAAIAAGGGNGVMLKTDGTLWTWGANASGELGDGSEVEENSPEEIVYGGVTAIASGQFHTLFLKSDGSLWGMGDNQSGQLGTGTFNNSTTPQEITTGVTKISDADSFHSMFLKSNGSLWVMGNNQFGELGDGTTNNVDSPEEIVPGSVVTAMGAGEYHSMFIKSDGSLWVMGWNQYGQLGDGTTNNSTHPEEIMASNVVAVAPGHYHSMFLKNDGSLWAMGDNTYGELGDGTTNNSYVPEEIVSSNVMAISSGGYHFSLFLKNDGSLWGMGNNQFGQLGDGTTNNAYVPEQIAVGTYLQYTASPVSGQTPLAVQFSAAGTDSDGNPVTKWNWSFGDGGISTAQNPVHKYFIAGNYSASLIATNNLGNTLSGAGPSAITANIPNLVSNGGFETGSFSGWGQYNSSGAQATVTSIYSHSGSYAAMFSEALASGQPSESVVYQNLVTQPGTNYIVSFWLFPLVNSYCSVDWGSSQIFQKFGGSSGWTNIQITLTATASITQLAFIFNYPNPYQSGIPCETVLDDVSVNTAPLRGFNQVAPQAVGTNMQLSFVGYAGANYALDRSFSLAPPNWIPQATNLIGADGLVIFTNAPNPATNNYWRTRYVP